MQLRYLARQGGDDRGVGMAQVDIDRARTSVEDRAPLRSVQIATVGSCDGDRAWHDRMRGRERRGGQYHRTIRAPAVMPPPTPASSTMSPLFSGLRACSSANVIGTDAAAVLPIRSPVIATRSA